MIIEEDVKFDYSCTYASDLPDMEDEEVGFSNSKENGDDDSMIVEDPFQMEPDQLYDFRP